MMKQLNFLLNTKELGIERHNVGAVVYCSENVPFKEILEQMPDVTKYLSGFHTPIPKMYFSTFRIKEWEGKATDSEQYIDIEDETINQEYADFFGVEVLDGSMLDEKEKMRERTHFYQKELVQNAFIGFLLDLGNIMLSKKDRLIRPTLSRKEELFEQFLQLLFEHCKEQHVVTFYAEKLFITPQYLS